jgi:dienelactone hydrolase
MSAAPALSAWAAGSSFAVDALERGDTPVDATRVGVFGHSRRGKAALLAGARDPRIAAVVAHQSGTLGSSILRNRLGEPLIVVTGVFPHWFTPELASFVDFEERLPFDQHHLLALVAPRPLLLVDGAEDDWADPQGTLDAARAADAAWELLGDNGLVDDDAGVPRTDATLVHRVRPGDHDVETADWELFLPFLARHLAREP